MTGADYVAVVNIYGPPPKGETLAAAGEQCDRVPASSLEWLEGGGLIRRVPPAEAAAQVEPAAAPRRKGKE